MRKEVQVSQKDMRELARWLLDERDLAIETISQTCTFARNMLEQGLTPDAPIGQVNEVLARFSPSTWPGRKSAWKRYLQYVEAKRASGPSSPEEESTTVGPPALASLEHAAGFSTMEFARYLREDLGHVPATAVTYGGAVAALARRVQKTGESWEEAFSHLGVSTQGNVMRAWKAFRTWMHETGQEVPPDFLGLSDKELTPEAAYALLALIDPVIRIPPRHMPTLTWDQLAPTKGDLWSIRIRGEGQNTYYPGYVPKWAIDTWNAWTQPSAMTQPIFTGGPTSRRALTLQQIRQLEEQARDVIGRLPDDYPHPRVAWEKEWRAKRAEEDAKRPKVEVSFPKEPEVYIRGVKHFGAIDDGTRARIRAEGERLLAIARGENPDALTSAPSPRSDLLRPASEPTGSVITFRSPLLISKSEAEPDDDEERNDHG